MVTNSPAAPRLIALPHTIEDDPAMRTQAAAASVIGSLSATASNCGLQIDLRPETKLVYYGIYEADDSAAEVNITLDKSFGSSILFLSSHSPVKWNVTRMPDELYGIFVTSFEGQSVIKFDGARQAPVYHLARDVLSITYTSYPECLADQFSCTKTNIQASFFQLDQDIEKLTDGAQLDAIALNYSPKSAARKIIYLTDKKYTAIMSSRKQAFDLVEKASTNN